MKYSVKIGILLAGMFLTNCINAVAQSAHALNIIDSLEKKGVSTLIHYYVRCEFPTLGYFNEYILWSQNSSTKLMTYSSSENSELKDRYKLSTFNTDSIFTYLDANLDTIKKERVYPFIYKTEGKSTIFSTMEYTHPCAIYFEVNSKKGGLLIQQGVEDYEESFFRELNLNYGHTSSTHLFYLVKLIQRTIIQK